MTNAYRILIGKPFHKRYLEDWEDTGGYHYDGF